MKLISGAVQADADICNRVTVDAPVSGVHIGPGIHVTIPVDWQTRCVAGEQIPGCSYATPEANGTMFITAKAEANQAVPANVAGANATALINFRTKLAAAAVIPNP
jgi:hypothetical protein